MKLNNTRYLAFLDQVYMDHTDIILEAFERHLKSDYGKIGNTGDGVYLYKYISDLVQFAKGTDRIQCKHNGDNFEYYANKIKDRL